MTLEKLERLVEAALLSKEENKEIKKK